VNGLERWACTAFAQDSITTFYNTQYVVWVDENKHGRIAKRQHGGAWGTSVDLQATANTALAAVFADDSHNVIVCAVDERGYIHVSGNHHASALHYMRSTKPGDISAWTSPAMVGTEETRVTYPQFFKLIDGTLMFSYRDGDSGNGDNYLNRYNHTTQTWTRVAKIWDGKTDNNNAYLQHIAVDRRTGRIHAMWTWRDTLDAISNEHFCYGYSDDDGVSWKKSDGSAYTLPITKASSEKIITTNYPTTDSPILNQGGLEVDMSGYPHAAILVNDSGSRRQVHHVWFDGTSWHDDTLTAYTVTASSSRPAVATFSDGTVWILFVTNGSGRPRYLRVLDVTVPTAVVEKVILATDLLSYEPAFDTQALYSRDELHLLPHMARDGGSQVGDPGTLGAQVNPSTYSFTTGSPAL
jgi:hypothetical protein